MRIEGVITAMVTPFDKNQQINLEATYQLIDHLIEKKVHGLFILGTNGEFFTINEEEKVAFAKAVIDYVNRRVPVYVGAGACGTKETIDLANRYKEIGADAISVITPYFLPITQDELVHHYTSIANQVDLPILMYNMPKNTGINIHPDSVVKLMKLRNIVGIKDSSGNMENLKGYIDAAKGTEFAVLVGSDSKILEAMKLGANGTVAGTSNVITDVILSIYHEFLLGNLKKAQQAQADVDVFRGVLPLGTVPSVLKRAITLLGIPVGEARFPVLPLGNKEDQKIKEALEYYHL